ncbi:MAG: DUF3263 domain-containing protein [Pontimonas sp.]|nr:DUF3263 domain-containing protein [Pontimonas sp.]
MVNADNPEDRLGAVDIDLLEFERSHWGAIPNKESAVRERFGLSLARYYQRVYALCHTEAAVRYDAVLVRQCLEAAATRLEGQGG